MAFWATGCQGGRGNTGKATNRRKQKQGRKGSVFVIPELYNSSKYFNLNQFIAFFISSITDFSALKTGLGEATATTRPFWSNT